MPSRTRERGSPIRRIAVVTGTRAEFGLLEPVLKSLRDSTKLTPHLIVTGMHLLPQFGKTIDVIRAAGWRIDAVVPMQTGRDSASHEPIALSRGIHGISRAIDRLDCDTTLVLGDRIEAFAGACATVVGRRVLAHMHGGDRATGDIDESLRDAMTRLAHIHFSASADAERRLLRMGEEPWRIHRVGAPGLDDIRRLRGNLPDRSRLAHLLGDLAQGPYALVVQHPCGRPPAREARTMRNIVAGVERCGLAGVVIYPNSDPGHTGILEVIRGLRGKRAWRAFPSLPRMDYLQIAAGAAVLVGNSSSGVIESASLRLPAVNVGPRQDGRLRCGRNVIDCCQGAQEVVRAIQRAIRARLPSVSRSVYGDGRAGDRTARVLERLIITPRLIQKRLTY